MTGLKPAAGIVQPLLRRQGDIVLGEDLTQRVIQTAGRQRQRLTADFALSVSEQPRRV